MRLGFQARCGSILRNARVSAIYYKQGITMRPERSGDGSEPDEPKATDDQDLD
jgi:hypothetical protein